MLSSLEKLQTLMSETNSNGLQVRQVGAYEVSYLLTKDPEKDKNNEDALFIYESDDHLFLGICDGAGGHPCGAEAAKAVAEYMFEAGKNFHEFVPSVAIEKANQKVLDLKVGAKSTLVMAWIQGDILRSASVGDSEIVYWNSLGNEIYSNIPHSVTGYKVEAGILDQAKALDSKDRNYVDNLLGDDFVRIELCSGTKMKKGHYFILGSDGLFDNFSHRQLSKILLEGGLDSFVKLCQGQDSTDWKKQDDLSFVCVKKTQ